MYNFNLSIFFFVLCYLGLWGHRQELIDKQVNAVNLWLCFLKELLIINFLCVCARVSVCTHAHVYACGGESCFSPPARFWRSSTSYQALVQTPLPTDTAHQSWLQFLRSFYCWVALFSFLVRAGDWTQNPVHARQIFSHWVVPLTSLQVFYTIAYSYF